LGSKLTIVGGGKVIVEVQLFFNETERLIECGEKSAEEDVEEMENANTMDVPEEEEK